MAVKYSRMLSLGSAAPDFSLPDAAGQLFNLKAIAAGRPIAIAFICNHCPFVKHLAREFGAFARVYAAKGLAVVAISANDVKAYPEDAPAHMAKFARANGFEFPYLYDESQHVALAYGAVCTPDFFIYDAALKLAYRGQFDDTRPGSGKPSSGADLRAAADAVLAGRVLPQQQPSAGCSIKWKAETEPDWA